MAWTKIEGLKELQKEIDEKNDAKTFRMWFQDGSTVSETWGGQNIIASVEELRKLAEQYSFDADEVLNDGETEMLEDGVVIGGVVTNED